jgi:hypothetical protein
MSRADSDALLRQVIGGDVAATVQVIDRARTSDEPLLLVTAALVGTAAPDLLARATVSAETTRDRQVVAIATAHLAGDSDLVDALAREHLVDFPDSIVVAWIAAADPTAPA